MTGQQGHMSLDSCWFKPHTTITALIYYLAIKNKLDVSSLVICQDFMMTHFKLSQEMQFKGSLQTQAQHLWDFLKSRASL